jgi:hypothetical protein
MAAYREVREQKAGMVPRARSISRCGLRRLLYIHVFFSITAIVFRCGNGIVTTLASTSWIMAITPVFYCCPGSLGLFLSPRLSVFPSTFPFVLRPYCAHTGPASSLRYGTISIKFHSPATGSRLEHFGLFGFSRWSACPTPTMLRSSLN